MKYERESGDMVEGRERSGGRVEGRERERGWGRGWRGAEVGSRVARESRGRVEGPARKRR
eukprot:3941993-Rhodomonas_salina.2